MRTLRAALLALFVVLICLGLDWTSRAGPKPPRAAKALDLYVVSGQVFVPGSRAAVRVMTRAVASITRSRPLAGARVTIELSDKHRQTLLFDGRSDGNGAAQAAFTVPRWPAGLYQMEVRVRSAAGAQVVRRAVQLKQAGRVLLVTDKPIYQPRQTMHLRALALGTHDLRPLANEQLQFQVMDPRGNKVFKQTLRSDRFGVAATTFALASEINQGKYQIEVRALRRDAAAPAARTVVVKKYVLPKFKVALETDHRYYLPRQRVKGTVRADYFFGKPVAGGKVQVVASTYDGVAFKRFTTMTGRTDPRGQWTFEIALPSYFVGQSLRKGNAQVKLEVKVTDTANHAQRSARSLPVAAAPMRLMAVPEGGRLVPGVKNQIFIVASYPDGSPAQAEVTVARGKQRLAKLRTDAAGLARLELTPDEKLTRQGRYYTVTRVGRPSVSARTRVLELSLSARDDLGNRATARSSLSTAPRQDRLLLRTDKAIYRAGDQLRATVLGAGSEGDTIYLDLVKSSQTLMTRAVRLRQGRGELRLPLGQDVFGTVELHAYRIQADGEITRDARVLYVQPANQLKVAVTPDKRVYRPGERALIRFKVTDAAGEGRAAALGVIVVDEAVYALQELKPGLEKVYFTLERQLSRPRARLVHGPADSLPAMIKAHQLEARRQRVAKVLLARATPRARQGLWANPVAARLQRAKRDRYYIRSAIQQSANAGKLPARRLGDAWAYRARLVPRLVKQGYLAPQHARDPLGGPYSARSIERLWPELRARTLVAQLELGRLWNLRWRIYAELGRRSANFTRAGRRSYSNLARAAFGAVVRRNPRLALDLAGQPYSWARLGRLRGIRTRDMVASVHRQRASDVYYALSRYGAQRSQRQPRALDRKRNAFRLPRRAVRNAARRRLLARQLAKDVWGQYFVVRRLVRPQRPFYHDRRLRYHALVSLGPDGQLGTDDDRLISSVGRDDYSLLAEGLGLKGMARRRGWHHGRRPRARMRRIPRPAAAMLGAARGGPAKGMQLDDLIDGALTAKRPRAEPRPGGASEPAAPRRRQVRVRNYFPETLAFKPALITDSQGRAQLSLPLADSITTWRMTASANSAGGGLGSASHGLRVFQDFFVDLDLPTALTQNDEVSVPVVVYNYLKRPQRVRLELKRGSWFQLRGPAVQELTLKPSEVMATYYRLRVSGLGRRTLQVRADGSAMSDAIRREIEVLPDGQERNVVANGRLRRSVAHTIKIPADAVPGASRVLVRLYPGVFSQVMEGMESMLRLPGG